MIASLPPHMDEKNPALPPVILIAFLWASELMPTLFLCNQE